MPALDTSHGLMVSSRDAGEDPRTLLAREAASESLLVLAAGLVDSSRDCSLAQSAQHWPHGPRAPDECASEVSTGADGVDAAAGGGGRRRRRDLGFASRWPLGRTAGWWAVYTRGVANAYFYFDLPSNEQFRRLRTACELRVATALAGYAETFPEVSVHTVLSPESPARALNIASAPAHLIVVSTRGPVAARFLGSMNR